MDTEKKLETLYKEIEDRRKEILDIKKSQPLEEIADYSLKDKEGNSVMLSDLFGDSDELLIIHNMGKACKYCTLWADGFRGIAEPLADRMPFVLVSPDETSVMKEFAESRNWNYPVISAHGSTFIEDLGFRKEMNGKMSWYPGASALVRKEGKIYRASKDYFGPGDFYNPIWHFMDLFPKGFNDWQPKYTYN